MKTEAENMIGHGGVLYISLADKLLSYIQENNIKVGERIPSERKLAEIFSTSRTSIREAIRILENKGLLEIQIGNGMYLKSDLSAQNDKIKLWKIDYMEMLEVKTLLEMHIIEEVCRSITESEVRTIEEALRRLERNRELGMFSIIDDNVFHNRIRQLFDNQTMIVLIENLNKKLDDYGVQIKGMEQIWLETIPYHRELLEAMKRHDTVKAKAAFQKIYELDKIGLEHAIKGDAI